LPKNPLPPNDSPAARYYIVAQVVNESGDYVMVDTGHTDADTMRIWHAWRREGLRPGETPADAVQRLSDALLGLGHRFRGRPCGHTSKSKRPDGR